MALSPETLTVSGWPKILLRLEGAALLAAASFGYWRVGGGLGPFAGLFFAPDLSFIAYLAGPRIGAVAYNCAHTTLTPLAVGAFGLWSGETALTHFALIHLAHIGFDRALGYGLKYGAAFGDTHLGRISREAEDAGLV
jgi:hypothetical protein